MKTVRAALVGLMVVGGADAQVRGGTETRFYGWSMDVTYTWETERGYQGSSGWLGLDPAVDWASPWTMDLRDRRGRDDRCVYPRCAHGAGRWTGYLREQGGVGLWERPRSHWPERGLEYGDPRYGDRAASCGCRYPACAVGHRPARRVRVRKTDSKGLVPPDQEGWGSRIRIPGSGLIQIVTGLTEEENRFRFPLDGLFPALDRAGAPCSR